MQSENDDVCITSLIWSVSRFIKIFNNVQQDIIINHLARITICIFNKQ